MKHKNRDKRQLPQRCLKPKSEGKRELEAWSWESSWLREMEKRELEAWRWESSWLREIEMRELKVFVGVEDERARGLRRRWKWESSSRGDGRARGCVRWRWESSRSAWDGDERARGCVRDERELRLASIRLRFLCKYLNVLRTKW